MDIKKEIDLWLRDGVITEAQAHRMLADSAAHQREHGSNKFIVAFSAVGALFLGFGAILFIAANWTEISDTVKIFMLIASTFGAYWLGYFFKYQKQNLPKVGASLIFLGALLFGATLFIIAQVYNVNANSHVLVLIWLLGILPFVYAFSSSLIAGLAAFLFYGWIGLCVFKGMDFNHAQGDFVKLPVLYLISGVLLFAIGAMHYWSARLSGVARIYRLAGIEAATISLFFLTFTYFSRPYETSQQFTIGFVSFSIVSIVLAAIALFFNPSKSSSNTVENLIALGLVGIGLIFFFFPATTAIYAVLFNLILVGLAVFLLYVGYQREDIKIVNGGISWLVTLMVVRYFDFFWDLMPRSLFFIVGGLIFVLGGIALEKKRRQLKEQFASPEGAAE